MDLNILNNSGMAENTSNQEDSLREPRLVKKVVIESDNLSKKDRSHLFDSQENNDNSQKPSVYQNKTQIFLPMQEDEKVRLCY